MGLFGNLFGKASTGEKEEQGGVPWIALERMEQLQAIAEKSYERPQLIFKHSTTCGISRMVLGMFSNDYAVEDQVDAHFLDLHAHRAISNEVAHKFGVVHQSPQLLVVKNGEVTFHTSHGTIADIDLQSYI